MLVAQWERYCEKWAFSSSAVNARIKKLESDKVSIKGYRALVDEPNQN